ncbi:MAG: GNAT family N-acetyltransferase [candidate division KSB1 bacterium]|nr:GNAT family N-acetyltransferase [candidate division KSB1 bacterium]
MLNCKILSLVDKQVWKECFQKLPLEQQDVYYTPEYYELYENYGDGKAQCFVFEKDGEIALYPFLMNSVNELGYDLDDTYFDIQGAYGYNGVLSSSYDKKFIDSFYNVVDDYCINNNVVAEFTRFQPVLGNDRFDNGYWNIIYDRTTVFIKLSEYDDLDDIWQKAYSKEARKNCRKAEKQQLYHTLAEDKDEFSRFYNLYLETMQYIQSTDYYLFSEEFFRQIADLKQQQELILVWKENQLLGCFSILFTKHYAHNFLSAGSVNHRKLPINDYMQNLAIQKAFDKGCRYIHFGGGNSKNEYDSLFKFKSKFSKSRLNFKIGKKIHHDKIYQEVKQQWEHKYPKHYNQNKHRLLGYRDIQ